MSKIAQTVPIVDLGEIGLNYEKDPSEGEWQRVAEGIINAFKTFGYVYLQHHGIGHEVINGVFKAGANFFNSPMEVKSKYSRDPKRYHGYVAPGRENLDPSNTYEVRESYDIRSSKDFYPDIETPSFRPSAKTFLMDSMNLSKRLMIACAIGLGIDRNFFLEAHKCIGSEGSSAIGRLNHYPPVPEDTPKDSVRCGVHADYGTFTLLFNEDIRGLELKNRQDEWIRASVVPGSIFMLAGESIGIWTSNKCFAPDHKVVIPDDESLKRISRQSLAYFVMPDDFALIQPLDGSEEFEPITTVELIRRKMEATYTY